MTWTRATNLSDEQYEDLYHLYKNEWWTEGRTRNEVESLIENSDEIVAFSASESDELIGFARVLTDYTYKALIFDMIVAPTHRGTGLGQRILRELLELPVLSSVKHFELYCVEELVSFYEQWGFSDELGDLRLMRCKR
jgi:predicted GNAT family N-acyltransferase